MDIDSYISDATNKIKEAFSKGNKYSRTSTIDLNSEQVKIRDDLIDELMRSLSKEIPEHSFIVDRYGVSGIKIQLIR